MTRFRLILALVAATACGGGGGGSSDGGTTNPPPPPPPPVATNAISLQGSRFEPSDIVVAPSTTVTFTNNDATTHNVIFANQGIAAVGDWSGGNRTTVMPAAPGTYTFTCTHHAGMNGSVKVQ
jgi:plastocyanin